MVFSFPSFFPQDCYILDHGGMKIYVWKGKGATKVEKQTAMSKALVWHENPSNSCFPLFLF